MSGRTSVVLLAVAVALGLYVYVFERGPTDEDGDAPLLGFEAATVTGLELPLDDGRLARLERHPDGDAAETWRLVEPLAWAADPGVISGIVNQLDDLAAEVEIDDVPADLGPFGLGPDVPPVRVLRGDEPPLLLYVGGVTPVGASVYVRVAGRENALFTVESWRTQNLRPDLFALRDKRVIGFEPDDVTGLRLLEDGIRVLALERREPAAESTESAPDATPAPGVWWLVDPLSEAADAATVRRLLQDLTLARATRFIDDFDEGDAYGLRSPRIRVELDTAVGSHELAVGQADAKTFLRLDGGDVIFETHDRFLDGIPRDLFAYRDRSVLSLDPASVDRIELSFPRDGTTHRFERREGRFVAVGADGAEASPPADAEKLDELLLAVSELEARAIIDASVQRGALGLDPARVRVTLFDETDAVLGWVALGDPDPDEGMSALSSRGGDRLWRVPIELGRDVPLGEEAYANLLVELPDAGEEPAEGEALSP